MFGNPLMLPLDKVHLCPLQLIFYKGREMKIGKEYLFGRFGRRLKRKGSKRKK